MVGDVSLNITEIRFLELVPSFAPSFTLFSRTVGSIEVDSHEANCRLRLRVRNPAIVRTAAEMLVRNSPFMKSGLSVIAPTLNKDVEDLIKGL